MDDVISLVTSLPCNHYSIWRNKQAGSSVPEPEFSKRLEIQKPIESPRSNLVSDILKTVYWGEDSECKECEDWSLMMGVMAEHEEYEDWSLTMGVMAEREKYEDRGYGRARG
ncbi:hypothetical protein J6590_095324, partial [Homalodisca vitripennis]